MNKYIPINSVNLSKLKEGCYGIYDKKKKLSGYFEVQEEDAIDDEDSEYKELELITPPPEDHVNSLYDFSWYYKGYTMRFEKSLKL